MNRKIKILAILQNQWFKNPSAVQAMFVRHPNKRNELIKRLLFAGCVTGRRLRTAFGDLCDKMIWEEASKTMTTRASGAPPADIEHIKQVVEASTPDLIVCFGKIAGDAVRLLQLHTPVIFAPHPAARGNTLETLNSIAKQIRKTYSL